MKGTIITLHVDGRVTALDVDGPPTLDAIVSAIGGGYLEVVPGFTIFYYRGANHECAAFCDEEGKGKDMPLNVGATAFWSQALDVLLPNMRDHLVGDVAVVFGDAEFMGAL